MLDFVPEVGERRRQSEQLIYMCRKPARVTELFSAAFRLFTSPVESLYLLGFSTGYARPDWPAGQAGETNSGLYRYCP